MSKREIWVLVVLVAILVAINVVNYIKRENLKRSYVVLIEEQAIQISINDTAVEELESLPGIGPVLASRIIEYRKAHGKFEKMEDIKKVSGIGDKLYQKILLYIRL